MNYLTHDGSFAGILSCIYHAYEQQYDSVSITTEDVLLPSLFTETEFVATDFRFAKIVGKRIVELVGFTRFMDLWKLSLSKRVDIGSIIFRLIEFMQLNKGNMLYDYSYPPIKDWIKELKVISNEAVVEAKNLQFDETNFQFPTAFVNSAYDLLPLFLDLEDVSQQYDSFCIIDEKREYGLLVQKGEYRFFDLSDWNGGEFTNDLTVTDCTSEILWVTGLEQYELQRKLRTRIINRAS